jgi:hypothetical protein
MEYFGDQSGFHSLITCRQSWDRWLSATHNGMITKKSDVLLLLRLLAQALSDDDFNGVSYAHCWRLYPALFLCFNTKYLCYMWLSLMFTDVHIPFNHIVCLQRQITIIIIKIPGKTFPSAFISALGRVFNNEHNSHMF